MLTVAFPLNDLINIYAAIIVYCTHNVTLRMGVEIDIISLVFLTLLE